MKHTLTLLFTCFFFFGWTQKPAQKPELKALRINSEIKIDGELNEPIWQQAQAAHTFTESSPKPWDKAEQRSEIKILYDNNFIYVGAMLYDSAPDSILSQLTIRDETGNTDIFAVYFDTYNDQNNAFQFMLTSAGVQVDARISPNGEDFSWNAVWFSQVKVNDKGWVCELKIPFSSIRFAKTPIQTWGVNFFRNLRRIREDSYWSPIDPEVDGIVNQFGVLSGIENIESPLRLQFNPYVASRVEQFSHKKTGVRESGSAFSGGMDVKYGINDAFTLDLTLIPDFGQVQSDNNVLNLSPFEVFFEERRPFFTEGTEIFNRGSFFYSRRIGGRPINYWAVQGMLDSNETIVSNPSAVQLINSAKVSGRMNNGLAIGVLNAVTDEAHAVVQQSENGSTRTIQTAPLTNYNVVVLDQNLKNNSYFTFLNTNVLRAGSAVDANVSGFQTDIRNKTNKYSFYASGGLSQHYRENGVDLGGTYSIKLAKVSGNVIYNVYNDYLGANYNPNDLGFLPANNTNTFGGEVAIRTFKPSKLFLRTNHSFNVRYSRMLQPNDFSNLSFFYYNFVLLRNFLAAGFNGYVDPLKTNDYFEPRTPNRFYLFPESGGFGGWFSSDYRKVLALDGGVNMQLFGEENRTNFSYYIRPLWRVNNHLNIIFEFNEEWKYADKGWVGTQNNEIILGERNIRTVTNTLNMNYIFTHNMSLSCRVRHYWSRADYSRFYELNQDGTLTSTDFGTFTGETHSSDVNFDAFNVDLVYSWIFVPGSELNITYKNATIGSESQLARSYFNDVELLFKLPQTNMLNIKFIYFLDYFTVKNRLKRKSIS